VEIAFATFLVQQGHISPDIARDITHWVAETRTPIGMIAFTHQLLSMRQIEQIERLRKTHSARFGELAAELGLLSKEQVATLLAIQQFRQTAELAERLATVGALSFQKAASALGEFLQTTAADAAVLVPDQRKEATGWCRDHE
jgi:hypothetical protein